MRRTHKLLSLIMMLCLVAGLLSFHTLNARATSVEIIQMNGDALKKDGTEWETSELGARRCLALEEGSYRLGGSIATPHCIAIRGNVTLDLNGFGILYQGHAGDVPVIFVESGQLTLCDNAQSKVTRYLTLNENGRATAVSDSEPASGAFLTVKGGYVTGSGCHGVWVKGVQGNRFTLESGSICGNGGVNCGGVFVGGSGEFIMSGGAIFGNRSTNGGGVCLDGGAKFEMSGGEIRQNSAVYGGGVYAGANAATTFTMSGGKITENTATLFDGGGVYVGLLCTFKVSGSATVSGNLGGADAGAQKASNVYLCLTPSGSLMIGVSDKMTVKNSIGVTLAQGHDESVAKGLEKYELSESDAEAFFCDDPDYGTRLNGGLVTFEEWYTVSFDCNGGHFADDQTDKRELKAFAGAPVKNFPPDPVWDGHVFRHWVNEKGKTVNSGTTFTSDASTRNLTAVWRDVVEWDELMQAFADDEPKTRTVRLEKDYTAPDSDESDEDSWFLFVESGYDVTLDLNGHTIDFNCFEKGEDGSLTLKGFLKGICGIVVYGKLTLTDSSKDKTGRITNGYTGEGGAVTVTGGSFVMNAGTISDSLTALAVTSDEDESKFGTATLTGGAIVDNFGIAETLPVGGVVAKSEENAVTIGGDVTIANNRAMSLDMDAWTNDKVFRLVPLENEKFGNLATFSLTEGSGEDYGIAPTSFAVCAPLTDRIGVSRYEAPEDEGHPFLIQPGVVAVVAESYTLTASDVAHIVSDAPDYAVVRNQKGEAELVKGHTVFFTDDDGSFLFAQGVAEGNSTVMPNAPEKDDYTFVEWQTADGATYQFGGTLEDNLTLTAVWKRTPSLKNVTVDAGGTIGATVTAPANALLIAASYDEDGRLLGTEIVSLGAQEPVDAAESITVTEGARYRLMLVSAENYAPQCKVWRSEGLRQ